MHQIEIVNVLGASSHKRWLPGAPLCYTLNGQKWLSKRDRADQRLLRVPQYLATEWCWNDPAESLTRSQSQSLWVHVGCLLLGCAILSCNPDGITEATRCLYFGSASKSKLCDSWGIDIIPALPLTSQHNQTASCSSASSFLVGIHSIPPSQPDGIWINESLPLHIPYRYSLDW